MPQKRKGEVPPLTSGEKGRYETIPVLAMKKAWCPHCLTEMTEKEYLAHLGIRLCKKCKKPLETKNKNTRFHKKCLKKYVSR